MAAKVGLFNFKGDRLDPAYSNTRDLDYPHVVATRVEAEVFWERYEPFADADFIEAFARNTEQRFWEMYLACALMDMGHELLPKRAVKQGGPDICFKSEGLRVWVEAIVPGIGDSRNPDRIPDLRPGIGGRVPVDQIVLRYAHALSTKLRRFEDYRKKGIIEPADACFIAVSGAGLGPGRGVGPGMPYIVRTVFPLGNQYATWSKETKNVVDSGYEISWSVPRASGNEVETGVFLLDGYSSISGVIFGPKGLANTPSLLGTNLITIHNPKASVPARHGLIPRGAEYWAEDTGENYTLRSRQFETVTAGR